MAVTSKPMRDASASSAGCASIVGTLLLLISIGPLGWLLNGGYSIQGMAWLANATGGYGKLFWTLATAWTVDITWAERAGLPLAQPVLPWAFVFATSFLQIGLFVRQMRHKNDEPLLDLLGLAVSIFDFATTAIGLVFAPFVSGAILLIKIVWGVIAVVLAVPLTFGFEALMARLRYFKRG
jgi:hypothetical protein